MTSASSESYLQLNVWFTTNHNRVNQSSRYPERFGGHMGLEIVNAEKSQYLGWWPDDFSVRHDRDELDENFIERTRRYLNRRTSRRTEFSTKPIGNLNVLDPDLIDSVLVGSNRIEEGSTMNQWNEALPNVAYKWIRTSEQITTAIQAKDDFYNERGQPSYHTIWRNCATACARILQAADIQLGKCLIYWSPSVLFRRIEAKRLLGAEKTFPLRDAN